MQLSMSQKFPSEDFFKQEFFNKNGPMRSAFKVLNSFKIKTLSALFVFFQISSASATAVTMGFGDKLQPFCFPESNSGIEVDIVRESLAYRGHVLHPVFYPIKRVPRIFIANKIDSAMMDSGLDLTPHGGVYAIPAVLYDNVFISLKKRNLHIKKPADLKNLTVLAFPGALERFPEWLKPVSKDGNYSELNDQSRQVMALFNGRYDLVLSDRYIFRYFAKQFQLKNPKLANKFTEFDFIKPDPKDYRLIFKSKAIADDYEAGLQALKKSGRYQKIFDQYLK